MSMLYVDSGGNECERGIVKVWKSFFASLLLYVDYVHDEAARN